MKHGHTAYNNHGCRCDVCKEGKRQYMVDYYERKRLNKATIKPIAFNIWIEDWEKVRAYRLGTTELRRLTGIDLGTINHSVRMQRSMWQDTYHKLLRAVETLDKMDRGEDAAPETDEERQARLNRRASIHAFNRVFDYLWRGGFTMETLAERLEVSVPTLEQFIESKYEDKLLAMKVARLQWIISRGDAEEDYDG